MISHEFNKTGWAEMDIYEQMGNIGSEVGRALKAKRQGNEGRMRAAFYRGLDLIDYTAEIWARRKYTGLKELLYARELFAESIMTDNVDYSLEDYFNWFAMTSRMRRSV